MTDSPQETSKNLYAQGKLSDRERALSPTERRALPAYESFESAGRHVMISRGNGTTVISETKIPYDPWDTTGLVSLIPTEMDDRDWQEIRKRIDAEQVRILRGSFASSSTGSSPDKDYVAIN